MSDYCLNSESDPTGALRPSITNPDHEQTRIPQLRICVTVPCGKKCTYCRPGGEGFEAPREAEMTVDQMVELTRMFVAEGVRDIKLTGGDPMLRRDIVAIVAGIRSIPGVRSLHLVTRHPRAGALAADLKAAGLDVLNFSIDSLDAHTWSSITGVKGHRRLINAVDQAAASGITIKLNTVVMTGVNDTELPDLVAFAGRYQAELKLLDLIDDIPEFQGTATPQEEFSRAHFYNLDQASDALRSGAAHADIDTQPGGLGHPMERLHMANGATVLIKSSTAGAWYGKICADCRFFPCHDALMAVRLTADGRMQYCLIREDNLVDLKSMVTRGHRTEAQEMVAEAIKMYANASFYEGTQIAQLRVHRRALPLIPTVR